MPIIDSLLEGDRFDEAVSSILTIHRDEVHQLRMAVSVLTFVPDAIDETPVTEDEKKLCHMQKEAVRIAKLYAQKNLVDGADPVDVIGVLQEGLA